jgi:hypothetical protein
MNEIIHGWGDPAFSSGFADDFALDCSSSSRPESSLCPSKFLQFSGSGRPIRLELSSMAVDRFIGADARRSRYAALLPSMERASRPSSSSVFR